MLIQSHLTKTMCGGIHEILSVGEQLHSHCVMTMFTGEAECCSEWVGLCQPQHQNRAATQEKTIPPQRDMHVLQGEQTATSPEF